MDDISQGIDSSRIINVLDMKTQARATRRKRSDELEEAIENDIVFGRLKPGDRLDEAALVARFGVSRTPIREAIIHLAASGLLQVRPRRGAVIADVGAQRLYEMFEVMAELEAMCARLATRRMSPEEQKAFLAAHEACRPAASSGNSDDYFHLNERFHELIYAGSRNAFLVEQARALQRRLRPYRRLQLRARERVGNSFAEHERIVAAMASGDSDLAAAELRKHVSVQGERFGDLVASLASLRGTSTNETEPLWTKAWGQKTAGT